MIEDETRTVEANEPEADRLPIERGAEEKPDYRRPRKLQLPSTEQSYFTIPEVEEDEQKDAEAQPEEGQGTPVTWGRRRRAGRGRR